MADYRYMLDGHFEPFFGEAPLRRVEADDIARYLVAKKRAGLATKTITNHLVFMHGLFGFAVKRGWAAANPVAGVDRPSALGADPDIRYLDLTELERHFQRSAYLGDEDLVFAHPQTGTPLDASKLRKRFSKALERAEVRRVRFHDLRHTFGTHCAAAGIPLRTLQEWMGHKDAKTTQIYEGS